MTPRVATLIALIAIVGACGWTIGNHYGPRCTAAAIRRGLTIRRVVAWYDLWIGVYVDPKGPKHQVYVLPLPCLGFVVSWWPKGWEQVTVRDVQPMEKIAEGVVVSIEWGRSWFSGLRSERRGDTTFTVWPGHGVDVVEVTAWRSDPIWRTKVVSIDDAPPWMRTDA